MPVICASFCKLMRVNLDVISPELFYLKLLAIYEDRSIYKYQVQSTGISNFKFEYFLNNETIFIPSEEIKKRFDQIIKPIFNTIALFGQKNMALRKSRDLLLPKLISGELDVSDLDIKTREGKYNE
jgi:type I restriction enzyme S subunit